MILTLYLYMKLFQIKLVQIRNLRILSNLKKFVCS